MCTTIVVKAAIVTKLQNARAQNIIKLDEREKIWEEEEEARTRISFLSLIELNPPLLSTSMYIYRAMIGGVIEMRIGEEGKGDKEEEEEKKKPAKSTHGNVLS